MSIIQRKSILSKNAIVIATILLCTSCSLSKDIKNIVDWFRFIFYMGEQSTPHTIYEYEYENLLVRRYDGSDIILELYCEGKVVDRIRKPYDWRNPCNREWGLYFQPNHKVVSLVAERGCDGGRYSMFKRCPTYSKRYHIHKPMVDPVFNLDYLDNKWNRDISEVGERLSFLSFLKESGQWHWMELGQKMDTLCNPLFVYHPTDVKMRVFDQEGHLLYSDNE